MKQKTVLVQRDPRPHCEYLVVIIVERRSRVRARSSHLVEIVLVAEELRSDSVSSEISTAFLSTVICSRRRLQFHAQSAAERSALLEMSCGSAGSFQHSYLCTYLGGNIIPEDWVRCRPDAIIIPAALSLRILDKNW